MTFREANEQLTVIRNNVVDSVHLDKGNNKNALNTLNRAFLELQDLLVFAQAIEERTK